jgi:hypothetical protein
MLDPGRRVPKPTGQKRAWSIPLQSCQVLFAGLKPRSPFQMVAVAEGYGREMIRSDPSNGNVGIRMTAGQVGRETPVAHGEDLDRGGCLDDVIVGHHVAALCIDKDAQCRLSTVSTIARRC